MRKIKQNLTTQTGGVWDYISDRAHIFSVIDWLATERRVSLSARGFQFFYYILYLSIGQISQLGDTFYFLTFFYIYWNYVERERRKEKKEEDGGEARGEGEGSRRVGGEDRGEDRRGDGRDRREDRGYRGRFRSY